MSLPLPQDASNDKQQQQQKKPRHRHSPAQLAALNELFEQDEHPPLELRSALAERLGMETKTVNAWFQNKRASSKKRSRAAPHDNPPSQPPRTIPPQSQPTNPRLIRQPGPDGDKFTPIESSIPPDYLALSPLYRNHSDYNHFFSDTETMPRTLQLTRPSVEQTEELRRHYDRNPHPTADQRQILAERLGMSYQSITHWFQNQRSLSRKQKDYDQDGSPPHSSTPPSSDHRHGEVRSYSAFPPPSNHPSLGLQPQHLAYHSAFATAPRVKRSPSPTPSIDERPPKRSSSSRYAGAPYSSSSLSPGSRPRRSRPEPYQLEALKRLFDKTPTPTIEERSALALEVGMDVSKVTNWFRNLRQTARKQTKRSDSVEDDDDDSIGHSGTFSPSFHSSASSTSMDIDGDDYDLNGLHSDIGSDDDYQEAVTPPPESAVVDPASATSASSTPSSSSRISISQLTVAAVDYASFAELEGLALSQYSGVKIEDALLLLSFHQNVVR